MFGKKKDVAGRFGHFANMETISTYSFPVIGKLAKIVFSFVFKALTTYCVIILKFNLTNVHVSNTSN